MALGEESMSLRCPPGNLWPSGIGAFARSAFRTLMGGAPGGMCSHEGLKTHRGQTRLSMHPAATRCGRPSGALALTLLLVRPLRRLLAPSAG